MKRYFYKWPVAVVAFVAVVISSSCNKQLDVSSTRQASEEGHWTKYEDARAGLLGMYGLFRSALADNNTYWILGELRAGIFRQLAVPI